MTTATLIRPGLRCAQIYIQGAPSDQDWTAEVVLSFGYVSDIQLDDLVEKAHAVNRQMQNKNEKPLSIIRGDGSITMRCHDAVPNFGRLRQKAEKIARERGWPIQVVRPPAR